MSWISWHSFGEKYAEVPPTSMAFAIRGHADFGFPIRGTMELAHQTHGKTVIPAVPAHDDSQQLQHVSLV
jgi:hypothetical protein